MVFEVNPEDYSSPNVSYHKEQDAGSPITDLLEWKHKHRLILIPPSAFSIL